MRAIQKLSRSIASALFTVALGETFDWVQSSVPEGEQPRYKPKAPAGDETVIASADAWSRPDGLKPTPG